MATQNQQTCTGRFLIACWWLMGLAQMSWKMVVGIAKKTKKIEKNDPRRIIHGLKAGLALTLVSLTYLYHPFYEVLGVNAIWAVLTVVVVFELSVGATLGKSMNRTMATMLGSVAGLGAHHLASASGHIGEPILLATFVFIIAAVVTFTRFFPAVKTRYDYGLSIFILTFTLVAVSAYRDNQVLRTVQMRIETIVIGCLVSVVINIGVYPFWMGEDLHNLIVQNLEKLAIFFEGFGREYFQAFEDGQSNDDKSFLEKYKSVLASKSNEQNMANLAKWEPCHGRFRFFHPWKQYLKIGNLARECAYSIEALNNILHSEIQAPTEIRNKFAESCTNVSLECGKALMEIASDFKVMKRSNTSAYIEKLKAAAEDLTLLLRTNTWEGAPLVDVVQVASIASILLEAVRITEKISDAINELASMAPFKDSEPTLSTDQPDMLPLGMLQPV